MMGRGLSIAIDVIESWTRDCDIVGDNGPETGIQRVGLSTDTKSALFVSARE